MLEQKDDICQSKEKTDEIRGSFNPKSLKSLHIDKLVRLKELQIQVSLLQISFISCEQKLD